MALGKTDTITWGGSNDRTGYQTNHNMDPAIVGSPQFGLLFKTLLPGTYTMSPQRVREQIFSQPLLYTASDGVQYVYIATTLNNIYKMNAKTGVLVASRNLHRPFLVSDLDGCTDINPTIGVTATGVIDPATVCIDYSPLIICLHRVRTHGISLPRPTPTRVSTAQMGSIMDDTTFMPSAQST